MFHRRSGVDQSIVAKMMYVLNESFDTLGDFSFSHTNAVNFLTRNFVAS